MASSSELLVAEGIGLFNAGRPAEALIRFRRAQNAAPRNAELLLFIGHCLVSLGREDEAKRQFRRAGTLGRRALKSMKREPARQIRVLERRAALPPPKPSRETVLAAGALLRKGRLAAAEKLLRSLLAEEPGHGEARLALSGLLARRARRAGTRAAGILKEAAALAALPSSGKIGALDRAVVLERRGRWEEASQLYARLVSDPRDGARACFGMAHIEQVRGREPSARRWLERAARLTGKGRPAGREGFAALMRLGSWAKAFAVGEEILDGGAELADVRLFWDPWSSDSLADPAAFRALRARSLSRFLARNPDSRWALYYRGTLTDGPGRFRDLSRIKNLPTRYAWMTLKAGWAFLSDGRFEEAARLLRRARAANPLDWWAHGFLAEAYLCLGRPGAALGELDRAFRVAPPDELGAVLAWRGELLLWLGRWRQAEAVLARAEKLGALFAPAWRGAALLGQGRRNEALAKLDEALRRYPRDREAYVWRGEALRLLGRPFRALRDLSLRPDNVWARINRGLIHAAAGDAAALRREYEGVAESIRSHVERRMRMPEGGDSPEHMRKVLEGALVLARGFRRDDYNHSVWMGPSKNYTLHKRFS